jgi:hypothetical protein
MPTVFRWITRLLLVLLAAVTVVAAIWAYARLTSPTDAQREAIALMQADPPTAGENGFPLLMRLPAAPDAFPAALDCGNPDDAPCIAAIESAPEANAAALDPFRAQLEAAAAALHAPVFRDERATAAMGGDDLPSFQPVVRLDTLRAFDFAAGDTAGALAAACDDARAAVRWAAEPDTLLQGMIGIAVFRQHAALITDMRRRAPGDTMPASCVALAEPPDAGAEGTLCGALRGEWRYQQRTLPGLIASMDAQDDGHWAAPLAPLLHDDDWLIAESARSFAAACHETARTAAADDRVTPLAPRETRWVDRVGFPMSMALAGIGTPAYADYMQRQLDFIAMRRLLAAFLQMDAMVSTLPDSARFAALPEGLRGGPRPLQWDEETGTLRVALRGTHAGRKPGEASLPGPQAEP